MRSSRLAALKGEQGPDSQCKLNRRLERVSRDVGLLCEQVGFEWPLGGALHRRPTSRNSGDEHRAAAVSTDIWAENADADVRSQMMSPEQVADLSLWLLTSPRNIQVRKTILENFGNPFAE